MKKLFTIHFKPMVSSTGTIHGVLGCMIFLTPSTSSGFSVLTISFAPNSSL